MKTAVSYINNRKGQPRAVQLPISHWTKLMNKLNKYEQMLSLKSDLTKAFAEVKKMQQGKAKKQSLQDFLNEL
jgi:hypothetical protein